MPDADKYRILYLLPSGWPDSSTASDIAVERDRIQAEYIAASEAYWTAPRLNVARLDKARAALLKHMEEHP